ncbi:MAG: Stk1 family PASTA domain-containing Ser/Thr kinase [Bacillota bacterium]
MIGRTLGNRYEILEQLGGGGMAIVYKGRDTILNRLVTIKLLRPEYTSDGDFVRRFRREAQAVASLSHPNIVSIYDVGKEGDMHYLVMEYVDGEDLRSIIKREGRLTPENAVRIARQVCDALDHAHDNNIVHRDVKPHNILITKSGRAKLTDFGIAREATAATITTGDTIVGSVHYISPEQARGDAGDPKSDIYSLGVVLYEMLTGSLPFTGDSPISIALKHINNIPDSPATRVPGLSPRIEKVVMRALNKEPEKRFGSAREMAAGLEETVSAGDDGDRTRVIVLDREEKRALKGDSSAGRRAAGRRSGKSVAMRWGIIAAVIFLLATASIYGYYRFVNQEEVTVPYVIGMSRDQAVQTLRNQKLRVKVVERYDQNVKKDYVIDQNYGPDDPPVKVNREVTITVSKGPDLGTVPNLVGQTINDARAKLAQAGFEIKEQEEYSDQVQSGYVIRQQPEAYAQAPSGSKVTVTVSKGPEPANITVPDLRGLTVEDARAKLAGAGLELSSNALEQSTDYPSGRIVSQVPGAGEMVTAGSTVAVTVSNGPGPSSREARVTVRVPDDGMTHVVKINVDDAQGSHNPYVNTHNPGEKFTKLVRYYGQGVIRVYIDGILKEEKQVK